MKMITYYIMGAIIIGSLVYGGFKIKRWFNYEFGYASQVRESVCDMVKPEYLKRPEDCK